LPRGDEVRRTARRSGGDDPALRYAALFEAAPDAIYVNRADRVVLANPACLELFGAERPDQIVGRSTYDLYHPDVHDTVRERIRRVREEGVVVRRSHERIVRLDGRVVDVEVVAAPFEEGGQRSIHVVLREITERLRAEERLRHQEMLLREAGEIAHIGAWEFDPATGAGNWTEETARIHDMDPDSRIDAARGLEFYAPESRARLEAALRDALERGTPYDLELDLISAKGIRKRVRTVCFPVVEQGRVVRMRGSFQDVSDRARLEAQLRQAAKLEAIGRLAGGVAHDFNNLLTVVAGNSEMLSRVETLAEPERQLVAEIQAAVDRAARLTGQLLAFSRSQALSPRVLDLNAEVERVESLLRRLIGEDLELGTVLDPHAGSVRVDPSQLEQVIVNLAVNARDAMPAGGRLTLGTHAVELDDAYCRIHPEAEPGRYAMLAVTDTGTGMPPEIATRIFEPFFTTKGAGKGTGLGLPTVFGIVKQSGGHVEVYTELGSGTCFKVYLPRVDERPEEPARPEPVPAVRGIETVLLVEDEPAVRNIARIALERHGYRVIEAASGAEALELVAGGLVPDVVVSDYVMPRMSGRELAERLRESRPSLPFLFISGYVDDTLEREGLALSEREFLRKPFSLKDLARAVRRLLDG
jgi:PAS domain S-box-containing protein